MTKNNAEKTMQTKPGNKPGAKPPMQKAAPGTTKRIFGYIFQYKWHVVAIVLCILVGAAAQAGSALFLQSLIDNYILPLVGAIIAGFFGRAIGDRPSEVVTTAFMLTMAYRTWQLNGNDEVQDDREDRRIALAAARDAVAERVTDDSGATLDEQAAIVFDETEDMPAIDVPDVKPERDQPRRGGPQ